MHLKRIIFLSLALSLLTLALHPIPRAQVSVPWQTLAPGIEFYKFQIPASDKALGPNEVFVARMDRSRRDVTLDTSLANGRLNNKTPSGIYSWEPISRQIRHYQGALNYWGGAWGGRNNVVVAINGYYHETPLSGDPTKDTSMPERGQVQSGWYIKRYYDNVISKEYNRGGSGFVWTLDGEAFIGGCVTHRSPEQLFIHPSDPEGKKFQGINVLAEYRSANSLILYTPQFHRQTPPADTYDIQVEMNSPTLIQPAPEVVTGTVKAISTGGGVDLPFAHVVFSASGDTWGVIERMGIQPGDVISVTQKVDHYVSGCKGDVYTDGKVFDRAYASLGTDFHFLKEGLIEPYSTNEGAKYRQPRTAIAFNVRYVFFIVVDGYHAGVSEGMNIGELGAFARDYLGATEAASLDSGTSSTFVVNGQTVNNYVCNADYRRKNPACNPQTYSQPGEDGAPVDPLAYPGSFGELSDAWTEEQAALDVQEPPLVNGLMMISVQEPSVSQALPPTANLNTIMDTELRFGPGTSYPLVATIPAGSPVTLLPHPASGSFVGGDFWRKVGYNGLEGWIPQSALPVELPFKTTLPLIAAP